MASAMAVAIRRAQVEVTFVSCPAWVARARAIKTMAVPTATAQAPALRAISTGESLVALASPIDAKAVPRTLVWASAHSTIDPGPSQFAKTSGVLAHAMAAAPTRASALRAV